MSKTSVIKRIAKANRTLRIVGAVCLLIFAVLIFVGLLPDTTKYCLASKNVFSLPVEEHRVDHFYLGKTYSLYDYFAENDGGRFYLTNAQDRDGEDQIMVVYIPNKYDDKAESIIEQTQLYMESGDENYLEKSISCRGYVTTINYETEKFLNEYFVSYNYYGLDRNSVSDTMFIMVPASKVLLSSSSLFIVLALALIFGAVAFLVSLFSKGYMKKINKRLMRESLTAEELDAEFDPPVFTSGSVYVSPKHVVNALANPQILTIADVVWIYPSKVNQINSNPIYHSVFMTREHGCMKIALKDQAQTEALCRAVHQYQPRALYGYVIENSELYYKHFNELIDQVYNQNQESTSDAEAVIQPDDSAKALPDAPEAGNGANSEGGTEE